jgi:cytochrome c-type biogenesis protein CcmH
MSRCCKTLLALTLLLAVIPGAGSAAVQPRASLPDVEDEVMCPTCGVPLINAFSPQAERERRFIRRQIALGKDKADIKQALVAEFGSDVLAVPRHDGFDLTAYVVPVAAMVIAALTLGFGALRWRRRGRRVVSVPDLDLSDMDSQRLDRELSRYDL